MGPAHQQYMNSGISPTLQDLSFVFLSSTGIQTSDYKTAFATIADMAGLTLQSTYKLVSGYEIPVVGFGVSLALYIEEIMFIA